MAPTTSRRSSKDASRPDIWTHIAREEDLNARGVPANTDEGPNSDSQVAENAATEPETEEPAEEAKSSDGQPSRSATKADAPPTAAKSQGSGEPVPDSTFLLFVGPRGAGKSTAIANFLNPGKADEKPKPSVALEYTFGRRTNAAGDRKDLCQIWELGGGDKLKELVPIVLTPEREKHFAAVVTVDLSRPEEAFDHAEQWTAALRAVSSKVPIVIFGAKYDRFQDQDGLKRKALCQALRYIACERKAGLVFLSRTDKNSQAYARAILSYYAFHTEKKRSCYVDPNKPLIIAPGRDRMEKIGLPTGMTPETPPKRIIEAWKQVLNDYFPRSRRSRQGEEEAKDLEASNSADEELEEAPLLLQPEPLIDAQRRRKDAELEQYRAQVARRARHEGSLLAHS